MSLIRNFYKNKDDGYFNAERRDIERALDGSYQTVLEIGCGTGATLCWLKNEKRAGHTCGIELTEAASENIESNADKVLCLDVETDHLPFDGETFDLILLLDVLEHLLDPWQLVDKLKPYLKIGGRVVVSIPNIRNLRALAPLVISGKWEYQESGLLDRTHLRFFTRRSIHSLFDHPDWQIQQCYASNLTPGRPITLFNTVTFKCLEEFLALQYVVAIDKVKAT